VITGASTGIGARTGAELEQAASAEVRALYGEVIDRIRTAAARSERDALPVDVVVTVARHALTAPRPRTRYLVGRDARLRATLQAILPDRVLDWMLIRTLRLPG
jgi:hypothetical protein